MCPSKDVVFLCHRDLLSFWLRKNPPTLYDQIIFRIHAKLFIYTAWVQTN